MPPKPSKNSDSCMAVMRTELLVMSRPQSLSVATTRHRWPHPPIPNETIRSCVHTPQQLIPRLITLASQDSIDANFSAQNDQSISLPTPRM
jgi:hypothetical protein